MKERQEEEEKSCHLFLISNTGHTVEKQGILSSKSGQEEICNHRSHKCKPLKIGEDGMESQRLGDREYERL